jgi:molecular chaperone Hsp33
MTTDTHCYDREPQRRLSASTARKPATTPWCPSRSTSSIRRGRVVRLGSALDTILRRHNYPEPVARLLGEAVVLAALIGSSLKFEGASSCRPRPTGR